MSCCSSSDLLQRCFTNADGDKVSLVVQVTKDSTEAPVGYTYYEAGTVFDGTQTPIPEADIADYTFVSEGACPIPADSADCVEKCVTLADGTVEKIYQVKLFKFDANGALIDVEDGGYQDANFDEYEVPADATVGDCDECPEIAGGYIESFTATPVVVK